MSPVVGSTVSTGAILFTDMVDSTALRSRLGDDRADLLRTHHDALLAGIVEAHGGAVTRFTGDGIKAAFGSASDAVGAAVAIQRAVIEYGTSTERLISNPPSSRCGHEKCSAPARAERWRCLPARLSRPRPALSWMGVRIR